MRYFSNFFEDRRILISVDPTSHKFELLGHLTRGGTLVSAPASTTGTGTGTSISPNKTTTAPINPDSFKTSNRFEILSAAQGGSNIPEWGAVGASSVHDSNSDTEPSYSDLSPEMRAHVDKFGKTPTYVDDDGKVHVDREALTQRVVDYYAGPEGGSMNLDGFSVQEFMGAGHDKRMSMIRSMREQNDLAKAAKFEEDMRLAQERDKQKAQEQTAAQPQPAQPNNMLGSLVKFAMQQVIPMLA
jgi:hypothetical protein